MIRFPINRKRTVAEFTFKDGPITKEKEKDLIHVYEENYGKLKR
jgi:hypothetical protein